MFHSRRFRAGVAGLFLGAVSLSGCAHDATDSYSGIWPFGKKSESTESSADPTTAHAAHIAQSSASKANDTEKLTVRQRLGQSLAKLVGRERDQFPSDPFISEYGQPPATPHMAKSDTARRRHATSGESIRQSANQQVADASNSGKPNTPATNVFASDFDQQFGRTNRVNQQRQQLAQDNQPRIAQSGGWHEQPVPDGGPIITPRADIRPGEVGKITQAGRNPFNDPQLASNTGRANNVEELTPPPSDTSKIVQQRLADLAAIENGIKQGPGIRTIPNTAKSTNATTGSNFARAIRTNASFAHGQGILPSQPNIGGVPQAPQGVAPVEKKPDSIYGRIRESEDVPTRKFIGPREFDAVQTNVPINLHPQLDPNRRELAIDYKPTSPAHPIISQTSLEVPDVATNSSVALEKDTPPIPIAVYDDQAAVGPIDSGGTEGPDLTNPHPNGGPLMISPSAAEPVADVDVADLDDGSPIVPQSPIESVAWVEDEFVVDEDKQQESSSWPAIAFLSLGLAAIVGLLMRRQAGTQGSPQQTPGPELRIVESTDDERKAA